jgi:hypothetical protein
MWNEATNGVVTKLIRITLETGLVCAAAASIDLGFFLGVHNNLHTAV